MRWFSVFVLASFISFYCTAQNTVTIQQDEGCVEPQPNLFQRIKERRKIKIHSQPEVVGGINDYINRIQSALDKKELQTEGLVFVKVFIDSKGEMTGIKIVKEPSRLTGKLVKQAIKKTDQKFIAATGNRNGIEANYKSDILIPVRVTKD